MSEQMELLLDQEVLDESGIMVELEFGCYY